VDESFREGIGLSNTRARLDALYPGASRLELTNASGGGARVMVRLPLRIGGTAA
jgi:sensor histidine kinase YesM